MIERLSKDECYVLAKRQRRFACLLIASPFVTGVFLLMPVTTAITPGRASIQVGMYGMQGLALIVVVTICLLTSRYIAILSRSMTFGISSNRVVITILGLMPLVQIGVGLFVLNGLKQEWKRLGLHFGLFGPSDAALDRVAESHGCYRCGYDIRGLESGTCPECGNRVERYSA